MNNEKLENDPFYYITVRNILFGNNGINGGALKTSNKGKVIDDEFIDKKLDKYGEDTDKLNDLYNTLLSIENEMEYNYDDEDELIKDRKKLNEYQNKVIEKNIEIQNKLNEKEEDNYSIESEYEENFTPEDEQLYDSLNTELLFLDNKIYELKQFNENDYKKYIETLYKLSKLSNNPEFKLGLDDTINEYEELYNKKYTNHQDYQKYIKRNLNSLYDSYIKEEIQNTRKVDYDKNGVNLGDGVIFEDVILNNKQIQKLISKITKDNSDMINNNKNPKLKGTVLFQGKQKPRSELYIYDLSQDKNDLEIKYFNTKGYMPFEDEIKRDGIKLQKTKFGNEYFEPLFKYDNNGDLKLFNIFDKQEKKYINNNFMKDIYVIYKTPSGIFTYHLNGDDDNIITSIGKDDDGKDIYKMKPKYKEIWTEEKDYYGNINKVPYLYIPYNKLKKIL